MARRALRGPLPRLVAWTVFTVKGMVAAGYWMFSGVTNLGDWGPDVGGGLGPLPWPWLWRLGLFVVGLVVYILIVRVAIRMLGVMLGGGKQAARTKRQIAMAIYVVGGVSALLVGLFNPHGMSITLTSSNASTAEASTAQLASALPIVIPGVLVSMPASASTKTSFQPICLSQDAVISARTSLSSLSTMRAPSVPA